MKRNKVHIFVASLLLFLFITGQYVVYAHQHRINTPISKAHYPTPVQTVNEKCQLCDAMHFNSMVLNQQYHSCPLSVGNYYYKATVYNFVSISLILAAGRAPPIS